MSASAGRRARVAVDGSGVRIGVRAAVRGRGLILVAVFGALWYAFWIRTIGEEVHQDVVGTVFAIVMLIVGAYFFVLPVAWAVMGRDVLTVSASTVELRRCLGPFCRTQRFAGDVGRVWTVGAPSRPRFYEERPLPSPGTHGTVAFEANGKAYELAEVGADEAAELVRLICHQLGRRSCWQDEAPPTETAPAD